MVGRWYGFDLIAREGARGAMLSSLVRQRLWPPPTCGSLWPRHFRQDGLWLAGELSGFSGRELTGREMWMWWAIVLRR